MKEKGFYSIYTDERPYGFNFILSDKAERNFTYSGVLDIGIDSTYSVIVIKHYSTRIIVSGKNLIELKRDLVREMACDIVVCEQKDNINKDSYVFQVMFEDSEPPKEG